MAHQHNSRTSHSNISGSHFKTTESHSTNASHSSNHGNTGRNGRKKLLIILAVIIVLAALVAALVLIGPLRGRVFGKFASSQMQTISANAQATPSSTTNEQSSAVSTAQAPTSASQTDAASSAATQAATPEPQEDTTPLDTSANAQITNQNIGGIQLSAPAGFESTPTMAHLSEVVQNVSNNGYKLGFVLEDLSTGRTLSYNADQAFYPASSIKAAYCAMVFENNGGPAGMSGTLEQCIVNSSNDAFHDLIHAFGLSAYSNWLSSHGAPNAGQIARVYYYPEISPNEMISLWKEIYRYSLAAESGSQELTSYLAQSNHSAMGGLLRDRYTVWSKPGWYPADGDGHAATVDCGVVFSDCGAYAYTVLSNIPEDFSQLMPVLDALNAAHGKMCGGSSALRQTSTTTVSGA